MTFDDAVRLASLLERYRAAMEAHEKCLTVLIDAMTHGDHVSADLKVAERRSQKELVAARKELLHALSSR